ncbi:MAG: DNA recombination protein RmuC [Cytophagales bacterium]
MVEYFIGALAGLFIGLLFYWLERVKTGQQRMALSLVHQRLHKRESELEAARAKQLAAVQRIAQLETMQQTLIQQLEHGEKKATSMEEKLLYQFKNISDTLLEQKSTKFTQQNKAQLDALLLPFKEKIAAFQTQVADNQRASIEGTIALKQEFQRVNDLYAQMREDAAQTTRALLGNNKLQGTWGEGLATTLLDSFGLRKNEQYFVQQSVTTAEGKRYIPDIIIKLPEGRCIVLDVKVSLVDYMKSCNAEEEEEKAHFLKKHLQSIKTHVKRLSEKNYTKAYSLEGLDFVLLLLPIERAFSLAIEQEPTLFEEAYKQNIVLVSPTTLRATLCMIDQIWKHAYRNQHANDIARKGGEIYTKFVNFVADLNKVRQQLALSQKSCDMAFKKLSEGRGNLIQKMEQLQKMGGGTHKRVVLPEGLRNQLSPTLSTAPDG